MLFCKLNLFLYICNQFQCHNQLNMLYICNNKKLNENYKIWDLLNEEEVGNTCTHKSTSSISKDNKYTCKYEIMYDNTPACKLKGIYSLMSCHPYFLQSSSALYCFPGVYVFWLQTHLSQRCPLPHMS